MTRKTQTILPPPPQLSWLLWSRTSPHVIAAILLPLGILAFVYYESLIPLVKEWIGNDTYSHGFLVPLVSGFLIWQQRTELAERANGGSWWGLLIIAAGLFLYILGELATLFILIHLSLWCILIGLLVSALGMRAVASISFPLGYLLTAIPLPQFLYQGLSGHLQLMSSALGVGCLQLVGVTAFREGNVIDLGPIQLQVVEACSGLRYLFPLTSLALLCAYLLQDRLWKRVVLFASSIPISILLNGFRIAMIGVLVDHFGEAAAEGFFHAFEGWAFFMVSFGILLVEMWVLRKIGPCCPTDSRGEGVASKPSPLSATETHGFSAKLLPSSSLSPYVCGIGVVLLLPLISPQIVDRHEMVPPRQPFLDFPMLVEGWSGSSYPLESQYIDALRFDDYLLADYRFGQSSPVTLYMAYYRSQRKGQSVHSPQSCIPGGGWEILSVEPVRLGRPNVSLPLSANLVLIGKNDQRQVVLYWFKQRDRQLTNEYLVKLYLVWDAIVRRRTDGGLIRLASAIRPGETEEVSRQRVLALAEAVGPRLQPYIPD